MYDFRSTERWLYICSVSEWRSPTMDVTRLCRTLPSSNILWNCDPPTCQKMAQLASVFNKISFAKGKVNEKVIRGESFLKNNN